MLNWREIPFVRLLLPFILGILLAIHVQVSVPILHGILTVGIVLLFFLASHKRAFRGRWIFGSTLFLWLFLFGYQYTAQHQIWSSKDQFGQFLDSTNTAVGIIEKIQQKGERYQVVLSLSRISDRDTQQQTCSGKLLSYFEVDSLSKRLRYGDRLVIQSKITAIAAPQNPNAFDFQKYWHHQNIYHQTFIRPFHWQLLERNCGHPILAKALTMRTELLQILKTHLPTENEYAVGAALILGNKNELSTRVKNAYAGTGAMHVLAVSGLHVGLIYLGFAFLLGLVRSRHPYWRLIKTFLLIGSIWGFALVTGASASVMRAATMFSFIIIGRAFNHQPNIYNTLAVSAFCLLCFNPNLLMDIGFQLSYLAVLGIVYFQEKIYRLWLIDNPIGDYIWKMSSIAIAAQLTTFPIGIYYFHQFPIYFWLSGLVVVPAAILVLGSGMVLFFTTTFIPVLNVVPATILYWTIWMMNALVFLIRQIPGAVLPGIWLSGLAIVFIYFSLGSFATSIQTRKVRWLSIALFSLVLVFATTAFTNLRQAHQQQIVIYKIRQKSLIDFIDGQNAIALSNEAIDDQTIQFTAQNHRWSKGIKTTTNFLFTAEKTKMDNWFYHNGFLQFFDKKMGIISHRMDPIGDQKIELDYLVLCNNVQWSIEELEQHFQFKKVILDASSSNKNIAKWKSACIKKNLDYHDINKQGALIINF